MNNAEKKALLVRNLFASLGGMILVILFVLFAPLYDIYEEFIVTFTKNTNLQIMRKYVFVIVVASFVIFVVGFYFAKKIMLIIKEHNARKIVEKHKNK